MRLVECIPNFSEGRRPEVVARIRDAIARVPGATVLDVSSDASHNRTVITLVAPPERVVAAAFAGIREAAGCIDLTAHEGCHPRLGAADVVPLVPLRGVSMAECVALARELGRRVGDELALPVYLYEHAATRPERRNLADVRRGGFEGLRAQLGTDVARDPDFGPRRVHATAGAVAIGARELLVAFNVHLGPAGNLPVARAVARAVRASSGGLPGVKALALEVDGQAQVSMNLVDLDATALHEAYALVEHEAAARGVAVTWSEIVGLLPEQALVRAAAHQLRLDRFTPAQLLERRVHEELGDGVGSARWMERLAAPRPIPAAGGAAALAGALAAALAAMLAQLAGRPGVHALDDAPALLHRAAGLREALLLLAERDEADYAAVVDLSRPAERGGTGPADEGARRAQLADALRASVQLPLDLARHAEAVARLALDLLRRGPHRASPDAYTAVALADAACSGAAALVDANVDAWRALTADASPAARASVDAAEREAAALALATRALRDDSVAALAARRAERGA